MNKKGADSMGEAVLMIYRVILIAIIAFVVLGISSVVFGYDVNVKAVEARILARDVLQCVEENGFFDKIFFNDEAKYQLLDVCGFNGDLSRVYVRLVFSGEGFDDLVVEQGDSGLVWLKDYSKALSDEKKKYASGYYKHLFSFEGNKYSSVLVEVVVR